MKDIFSKRLASVKWDKMSVSLNKPIIYNSAETACIGYIFNGEGFISHILLSQYEILQEPVSLGKMLDVAVCYDGRWRQTDEGTFGYFTFGEPWIFFVDLANRLYMQRGVSGARTLIATGVTRVSACRGWKHVSDYSVDQGLCIYYVKGTLGYVRSYIETSVGKFGLSSEEALPQLGSVKEIVAKRTNDYRIMIVGSSDVSNDVLAVTERTWPGMSVKSEILKTNVVPSGSVETTGKLVVMQDIRISAPVEALEVTTVPTQLIKEAKKLFSIAYNACIRASVAVEADKQFIFIYFNTDVAPLEIPTDWFTVISTNGYKHAVLRATNIPFGIKLEVGWLQYGTDIVNVSYLGGALVASGSSVETFTVQADTSMIIKEEPIPPELTTITVLDRETLLLHFDQDVAVSDAVDGITITYLGRPYSNWPNAMHTIVATGISNKASNVLQVSFDPLFFSDALSSLKLELDANKTHITSSAGIVESFSKVIENPNLTGPPHPGAYEIFSFTPVVRTQYRPITAESYNASAENLTTRVIPGVASNTGTLTQTGNIKP